jgi:alpha-L-arabinofuranosidase
MLSKPTIDLLNRLCFRTEAKRMISVIPLGSIYWEDEMPKLTDLIRLPNDQQKAIWRIFAIRMKLWDLKTISNEDQGLWGEGQSCAPNWAVFQRLSLSAEDQTAREKAEKEVEKEFEDFFNKTDNVQVGDEGHGLQGFSATFDLRKKKPQQN